MSRSKIALSILILMGIFKENEIAAQEISECVYYLNNCKRDTVVAESAFTIAKKGNTFKFVSKSDTIFLTTPDAKRKLDTLINKASNGPYVFKKVQGKILFARQGKKLKFHSLYILSRDSSFQIPDLWSSSADSYFINCIYSGDHYMVMIGSDSVGCYKFIEKSTQNHFAVNRIVYLSEKLLIPVKLEYFNEANACKKIIVADEVILQWLKEIR